MSVSRLWIAREALSFLFVLVFLAFLMVWILGVALMGVGLFAGIASPQVAGALQTVGLWGCGAAVIGEVGTYLFQFLEWLTRRPSGEKDS